MYRLDVKPLSLNNAYSGRRFATEELKQFKKDISYLLPRIVVPTGILSVKFEFGVSTKNSDGDNLVKITQDCLAEKYGFNDRQIYRWEIEKVDVPKGEEYILFSIRSFT